MLLLKGLFREKLGRKVICEKEIKVFTRRRRRTLLRLFTKIFGFKSPSIVFCNVLCCLGPVHMVSLGEISRQVRKNMSGFHMGDVISPSEVKSTRGELAPNQNTAFHPCNRADVFIWRIFIPPTYDLASHRRDLGK